MVKHPKADSIGHGVSRAFSQPRPAAVDVDTGPVQPAGILPASAPRDASLFHRIRSQGSGPRQLGGNALCRIGLPVYLWNSTPLIFHPSSVLAST